MSNVDKGKPNSDLLRESSFTKKDIDETPGSSKDVDEGGSAGGCMLNSIICDPKVTGVENTIISEVETNDFANVHFDLDTFVDKDLSNYKENGKITPIDTFCDDDESNE